MATVAIERAQRALLGRLVLLVDGWDDVREKRRILRGAERLEFAQEAAGSSVVEVQGAREAIEKASTPAGLRAELRAAYEALARVVAWGMSEDDLVRTLRRALARASCEARERLDYLRAQEAGALGWRWETLQLAWASALRSRRAARLCEGWPEGRVTREAVALREHADALSERVARAELETSDEGAASEEQLAELWRWL